MCYTLGHVMLELDIEYVCIINCVMQGYAMVVSCVLEEHLPCYDGL